MTHTTGHIYYTSSPWLRNKLLLSINIIKDRTLNIQNWYFEQVIKGIIQESLINSPYEVKYRWNEYHNNLKYQ